MMLSLIGTTRMSSAEHETTKAASPQNVNTVALVYNSPFLQRFHPNLSDARAPERCLFLFAILPDVDLGPRWWAQSATTATLGTAHGRGARRGTGLGAKSGNEMTLIDDFDRFIICARRACWGPRSH